LNAPWNWVAMRHQKPRRQGRAEGGREVLTAFSAVAELSLILQLRLGMKVYTLLRRESRRSDGG